MTPRVPNISPLQVVYTAFPASIRFLRGQMARVRTISSSRGDREDPLSILVRRALARRIFVELERRHAHEAHKNARRAARRAAQAAADQVAAPPVLPADGAIPIAEGRILSEGFDALADLAFGDDDGADGLPTNEVAGLAPLVPPTMPTERDISLIEVDEDATVRTRVFPRSVHCQRCGHFQLLDPDNVPATLGCPCCRGGMLRVEPIVFVCGRCAEMRELVPPLDAHGEFRRPGDAQRALGGPTRCPDCQRGHIHLEKHGTNQVARWEWECTARCGYRVVLQERCLKCAVSGARGEAGSTIFMNALPASAPNALQSLVHQEMFVDGGPVDPNTLAAAATRGVAQGWRDSFVLDTANAGGIVSEEDVATLRDACIARAFLVNDVWAVTAAFGYKAGPAASHPQSRVETEERLAHIFGDPEGFTSYRAFTHSTNGNALVVQLDPRRVLTRLQEMAPTLTAESLQAAIAEEAQVIGQRDVRDLLRIEGTALLAYRALHALEHALLNAAMRQLGTDALGSRLFPSTAAVVIFEKARVGRGGVIQLVNRGEGLVRLVEAARDLMQGCAQGCVDGCPTCAYMVRDQFCTHPLDELGASWLPANALLSRRGAAAILSSEGAH